MDDVFEVVDPRGDKHGEHLDFTIHDGTATIPARISGPAMQILADDTGYTPVEVFKANQKKIRTAAYKARRFNPTLAMVVLGTRDFS